MLQSLALWVVIRSSLHRVCKILLIQQPHRLHHLRSSEPHKTSKLDNSRHKRGGSKRIISLIRCNMTSKVKLAIKESGEVLQAITFRPFQVIALSQLQELVIASLVFG